MTGPPSGGYSEESVVEAAVSWGQLQGQRAQSAHEAASLLTPTASSGGALRSGHSLQRLTQLSESSDTHGCGFLQGKGTDEDQPKEEIHRARYGGWSLDFCAVSGHATLPASQYVHQLGSSPNPIIYGF